MGNLNNLWFSVSFYCSITTSQLKKATAPDKKPCGIARVGQGLGGWWSIVEGPYIPQKISLF